MKVNDYFELLALCKILLEAKFHEKPSNMYVQISPYTSRFCNQTVDDLIKVLVDQGNDAEAENWKEWRKLSNRVSEKAQIVKQFDYYGTGLLGLSEEDKVNVIKDLTSPFIASSTEVQELLDLLNKKIKVISNDQ